MAATQTADSTQTPRQQTSRKARRQTGPVFVPPRGVSEIARALLSGEGVAEDRITAYDELWYAGRPTS